MPASPDRCGFASGYLLAMAADGAAGSASGDVAARLGRGVTSFGPARASLIAKA